MFAQRLAKFREICHNENVNKNRGIWMTELLADRKEQNVCWNYHLNRNNILNKAIMESLRSQLSDKNSTSYRLNVLTSYQRGALCIPRVKVGETRMNTEFCGGGGTKL